MLIFFHDEYKKSVCGAPSWLVLLAEGCFYVIDKATHSVAFSSSFFLIIGIYSYIEMEIIFPLVFFVFRDG